MLIDSHCHINALDKDKRDAVLAGSSNQYIFIDSSIDLENSRLSLELSGNHENIYSALGFHPFCTKEYGSSTIDEYQTLISSNKKIVAIGEIGLDFKADSSPLEQEKVFKEFIKLACERDLPIMIHNRTKSTRILDVIDDFYSSYGKVIFHCFSYSTGFLDRIIEKRGFVSFSLNILRKNADIIASLKRCPPENTLLETDSPYMRIDNRLSTPLDIKEVYSLAARVKDIEQSKLEEIVYLNAKKVFNIG